MKQKILLLLLMLMGLSGSLGLNAQNSTKEAYYAVEIDFKEYVEYYQEWIYWGVNVTFYYDNLRSSRGETYLLPQNGGKLNIPNSVSYVAIFFNNSFADYRPTNTSYWFSEINAETCVNFYGENLNTSAVTNMSHMFYRLCGDDGIIGSFDLSHFDLSSVTDMSYMFAELGNMENGLDISALDFRTSINTTKLLEDAKIEKLTVSATANNLASDAFTGMGNAKYPRTLECTTNFTLEGATQYDGYVKWKGGYFNVNGLEPYAELSSDNTTLTFYYDNQRNSRTGTTYDMNTGVDYPGWYENRSAITNVVFDTSFTGARPTCCDYWFEDMSNLSSISGLNYLNTSSVTSMEWMFGGCSKLTSLNVSGFNTENVQNMTGMFGGCSKLTSLDVSRFKTEKVLGMGSMFSSCTSLSSLDVSRFNTGQVVNTSCMFFGCENITTIDVSDWDVSHVETMMNMFDGCKKLSSLDLSSFVFSPGPEPDVSSNEYYKWMLADCTGLQTLIVPASAGNLPAGACEGVGTQSAPCTLIYPSGFTPEKDEIGNGWYRWKGGYFKDGPKPYAVLSWDKTTLTFYCDTESTSRIGSIYDMNTGNNVPRWYNSRTNVTTVVFDPSFANARPSSCFSWFAMPHLNSITGLEYLNTSAVTDMEQMFTGCPLESIDVSHFNTANVTTMDGMFYGCANLKSIDVSGFNTNKMNDPDTGIISMFTSCTSLTSLDLSSFTFYTVANTASMLSNCTSLQKLTIPATAKELNANACSGVGMQDAPCTLVYPNGFTPEKTATGDGWYKWKSGYFKDAGPEPYAVLDGSTLTFYYDSNKDSHTTTYDLNTGNNEPEWYVNASSVTSVVFDSSFADARPTSCHCWFSGMNNLTTITDIGNLNTDEVTTMYGMFNGCTGLTTLDVSGFNTSKVTSMQMMFASCSGLTSLDVSGFDTSKVTSMASMFDFCSGLTSLDVSGFDTSNVIFLGAMFFYCSSLTSLDVSGFNTANVTNMGSMFHSCSGLTSLDVSGFVTSKVTVMSCMFYGCSGLTSLDISGFNTEKVNSMSGMFMDCSGLTSLDLSNFTLNNTASGTYNYMLQHCSGLQTLTIPANADRLGNDACQGVGTASAPCVLIYPNSFTPPSSTGNYFLWKGGYFKKDLKAYAVLDGSTLTFYFDDQRSSRTGTTYDLNTENNTPGWYDYRTSVTTVVFDPSFADARPSSCFSWFVMFNLNSITGLEYLNTSAVTNMMQMFMGCPLESIDVSHFNTANVTAMGGMFYQCSNLKSIDLSSFNTNRVDDPYGGFNLMFSNCTSLTNLDLSNFTFASVASTDYMLYGCSGLQKLAIPATATELSADACSGVGTRSAPCSLVYPDGFTPEKTATGDGWYRWKGGYFKDAVVEPYAVLSTDNTTLTFCYDKQKGLRPGTSYDLNDGESTPGWYIYASHVTNVDFNFAFQNARPTSCYMWFSNMTNLTTIEHLDYLNTSEVTDMRYMFQRCLKLTSLDISTFDTEKVTNMAYMFDECTSLETLTGLSSFHTSNVTSMYAMFQNCSSLTELKGVNGFNMNNVITNEYMFKGCSSLTRLILGYFQIPSLNSKMLSGCTSLQALSINPTREERLSTDAFEGVGTATNPCVLLTEAHITPDETFDGYFKWGGGFFKDAEKEPYAIFHGTTLTFVYDKWRPIIEDETFGMESLGWPTWLTRAGDIVNVVFMSSFAEVRPTSTARWFSYMTQATGIVNLCYLNTSDVTNMVDMFQNCSSLTSLDVSSFNTANVTNMEGMFNGCSGLTSINVSGLNTANVTTMERMFYGCSSLTSLDVSGFNTANVKTMQNMFYKCSSLTSLDLSNFNTEKVTNMSGMFQNCSSLTSIDVSGFNTQRVGYMGTMFNNCTSLTSLDLSSFTIPLNGYWSTMMKNCTSLQTLTVPATAGNLPAGACEGVGTQSAPCTLIYPSSFTPEKDEIGNGWYKWKSGYFKDRAFPLGDVNHDGEVTILDVTLLVDHLLSKNPSPFYTENADVNSDQDITITDVTALVNILLHQSASHAPATAREATFDRLWLTTDGNHCLLHLDTPERYTAMHLTLRLPEGGALGNMRLSSSRSAGHHVETRALGDGLYNVVLCASDNAELRSDVTELLHFDLAGCQPQDVEVVAVQSTNRLYETIMSGGMTTGIEVVEVSDDSDGDGYNTVGVRVGKNARGVVIRNGRKKVEN